MGDDRRIVRSILGDVPRAAPAPLAHSPECVAATERAQAARAAWAEKWPNHCAACEGWGGRTSYYDPSPAGVALSAGSMPDFDTCADCTDQGRCGRCGGAVTDDAPCPSCGWNCDDGMPAGPDGPCACVEEEMARYDKDLVAFYSGRGV
jgi:hypothetical protein